jgi:hypothetical protein
MANMKDELKAFKALERQVGKYKNIAKEAERTRIYWKLSREMHRRQGIDGGVVEGKTNSFTFNELVELLELTRD